ncbi:formylglycine-generating enzyme family protein [Nocardia sp. CDC160]|uniref:formylglycine-generating enzyme family protein n=1 Tax=Nocardia sp. CDC160 TaxID=3112166 RepID=UPI002DB7B14D|nr:SUMF1/EgtB/PvdO family nonheme iron enzyme [Nocardia sp. CDC160]MEC3915525.1 SUMF1/EgtB/PvdO family nonheme iron enzyme [Nocardia sp. CDC160]
MTTMIEIPAARVEIGAPEHHLDSLVESQHYARSWFEDEAPQHIRHIAAFQIDRTPVTNAAFSEFVGATGYVTGAEQRGYGLIYGSDYWHAEPDMCWRYPAPGVNALGDRPEHPVIHVDHTDATAYASWASKRLPTEDEWEYAAHGASWSPYPWGHEWNPACVNCVEHWADGPVHALGGWQEWWQSRYLKFGAAPATTDVGSLSPAGDSEFGVADMSGTVAEWTCSTYSPYDPARQYDPALVAAMRHGYRVVRGGSWKHMKPQVRTTERMACEPMYSSFELGFRCAADAEPNHA